MLAVCGQSVRGSDRRCCVAASQSISPAAPEASQASSRCGACGMAPGWVMRQRSKPRVCAFSRSRPVKAASKNRDPRKRGSEKYPASGPPAGSGRLAAILFVRTRSLPSRSRPMAHRPGNPRRRAAPQRRGRHAKAGPRRANSGGSPNSRYSADGCGYWTRAARTSSMSGPPPPCSRGMYRL